MRRQDYQIKTNSPKVLESSGGSVASVLECDITPPLGFRTAGYSILGRRTTGVRLPLKARVFYLRDKQGHSLALVQCDLLAGSLLLQRLIAEKIATETDISAHNLILTASHTHAGPGNFFESDFYNQNASSVRGLSPELVEFLTTHISKTITRAFHSAKPAKFATGRKDVFGISRNRALRAWLKNPGTSERQLEESVQPGIFMLRIDTADGSAGCFAILSTHCTALTAPNTLYSADLFGFASKHAIRIAGNLPICAISAGTQGDQNPALGVKNDTRFRHLPVDWEQAEALGITIGTEIAALFTELENHLVDHVDIHLATSMIDLQGAAKLSPSIGCATIAGAEERRSPWLSAFPLFDPRSRFSRRSNGKKRVLKTLTPPSSFPRYLQLSHIEINDFALLPLPFEVTAEAGRRISTALRDKRPHLENIAVTSVSNGYLGYLTTPEEYSAQEYEGASTLYGEGSCPFVIDQIMRLAQSGGETLPDFEISLQLDRACAIGKRIFSKI